MVIKMVRLIIFDFDGTLVDSFTLRPMAWKEVAKGVSKYLKEHGIRVNINDITEEIGKLEREMNYLGILDRKEWWRRLLKKYGIPVKEDLLLKWARLYWNVVANGQELYSDVTESLKELKKMGYSLALLTDTDGLEGMKSIRIEKSGLKEFFDDILIAGEDVAQTKPSDEPFRVLLDKMGVSPSNSVHIGDSLHTDVPGAKKVGIITIIVIRDMKILGNVNETNMPDMFIKDLYTIIRLLKKL